MFHKRKKTKTEVVEQQITLARVVKLTYLQSLALEGSLFNLSEFETESVDEFEETTRSQSDTVRSRSDKLRNNVNEYIYGEQGFIRGSVGEFLEDISLGNLLGSIGSLFGKSVEKTEKTETKETGFQVTKVWNQPQFDVIRYAIGIKDINVAQFTYAATSEIISKPWKSPKEIIKVVCRASQFIPSIFPVGNYIEYYIKPNQENATWTRINPLDFATVFDSEGKIIPRVINFNTEQPLQSRLEEAYVLTEEPVKEVVFKAILKRPESLENTTVSADGYSPILKSYRLLMTPKNGL